MGELSGKVAIVTGAGRLRGIGRSTALALARAGADLVITGTGRPPETFPADEKAVGWRDIESVADQIGESGVRALPLVVDISKSDQVDAMVERTLADFGRIDILVNNAAYSRGPDRVPAVEMTEEVWRRCIDVDINGTFLTSRAVARVLIRQAQGGRIVNIASLSGKRARPNRAAYVTAKFGIVGLTQALAWELGPHGINVNCICPGTIDTSRVDDHGRGEEWQRYITGNCALRRAGSPGEIAGLAVFLCSAAADFIVGQSINMDGGQVMH
ncbi:MAG: SDR family oxidoreductase [Chloroflexi bacterium]|nr:SDR family oxidoreductase [Chloroflexota bacterium]